MERTVSEAATDPELPWLPARLRKSASDKSAFAHFVAEEDVKVVEARRPVTSRDGVRRRRPLVVAEPEPEPEQPVPEEEAGDEVDRGAITVGGRPEEQRAAPGEEGSVGGRAGGAVVMGTVRKGARAWRSLARCPTCSSCWSSSGGGLA